MPALPIAASSPCSTLVKVLTVWIVKGIVHVLALVKFLVSEDVLGNTCIPMCSTPVFEPIIILQG